MQRSIVKKGSTANKVLSMLLSIVMVVSLMPSMAWAAEGNVASGGQEPSASSEPAAQPSDGSKTAQDTAGSAATQEQQPAQQEEATSTGDPTGPAASDSAAGQASEASEPNVASAPDAKSANDASGTSSEAAKPAASETSAVPVTHTFTDPATHISLEVIANDDATAAALPQATLHVRANDQIDSYESAKASFSQTLGQEAAFDLYDIQLIANGSSIALASEDAATITLSAASDTAVYGKHNGQVVKLESSYTDGKIVAKAPELGVVVVVKTDENTETEAPVLLTANADGGSETGSINLTWEDYAEDYSWADSVYAALRGPEDELPAKDSVNLRVARADASAVRDALSAKYDGVGDSTVRAVYDVSVVEAQGSEVELPESVAIEYVRFLGMVAGDEVVSAPSAFAWDGSELTELVRTDVVEGAAYGYANWQFDIAPESLGTYALVDMSGLTEKKPAEGLAPGVYTADINIYVPAEQAPIKKRVYVSDSGFPPINYQKQNGQLTVQEDGTVLVEAFVNQPVFWVEKISSGENVEVLNVEYSGDLGSEHCGYRTRIVKVTAKIQNEELKGSHDYQFGDCVQVATPFEFDATWDMFLQVDFDSAVLGEFNPPIESAWSHTFVDDPTGISMTVSTNNDHLGTLLSSYSFNVVPETDGAVKSSVESAFSKDFDDVPSYKAYSLNLVDASGNGVDVGDASISVSLPNETITNTNNQEMTKVYMLVDGNLIATASAIQDGKVIVPEASLGTIVVSDGWESAWMSKTAEFADLGATATLQSAAQFTQNLFNYITISLREENIGGTHVYDVSYCIDMDYYLEGDSFYESLKNAYEQDGLSSEEASREARAKCEELCVNAFNITSGLEDRFVVTVPVESNNDRVVLVYNDGSSKTTYTLPVSYGDGKATVTIDQSIPLMTSRETVYSESFVNDLGYTQTYSIYPNRGFAFAYRNGAESATAERPTMYLMVIGATDSIVADPEIVYSGKEAQCVYTGEPITGVELDENCEVVSGNVIATNAGKYSVVVRPKAGYAWVDGTSGEKTVEWTINKAPLTVYYRSGVPANPTQADLPSAQSISEEAVVTGFVHGETADTAAGYVPPAADASKITMDYWRDYGIYLTEFNMPASADNYTFKYDARILAAASDEDIPHVADGLVYNGQEQQGIEINATSAKHYLIQTDGSLTATDAGTYTVTFEPVGRCWPDGSIEPREFTYTIAPAELTATYAGETVTEGGSIEGAVSVEGFVNGETAETAAGYVAPTVTEPSPLEVGTYELSPAGGDAKNYTFTYVPGTLTVEALDPGDKLAPGTYTVTANLALSARDASAAGFTVLAGLAGADGAAYMTNPANPLGRVDRVSATEGLPTVPATLNARLTVDEDGTGTLFVPVANPIFTLQKLGTNVMLPSITTTTASVPKDSFWAGQNYNGAYGDFRTRIDSFTATLPNLSTESYVLEGCQFHPTLFAGQQLAGPWTVPMTLSVDFSSATTCETIDVPVAKNGLVANGSEQTGIAAGMGYTLVGTTKATEAGTYVASATPNAGFAWADGTNASKLISWTIAPAPSSVALKNATAPNQTYTGAALKPAVTVKDANGKTVPASAYTVTYANNKSVGTATATVKAKAGSGYTGTVKATFKISPAIITSIASVSDQLYNAAAKLPTPKPQVKSGDTLLKEGVDYMLSYRYSTGYKKAQVAGGKYVGSATVTVTGKGSYTGRVSRAFRVYTYADEKTARTISAKAVDRIEKIKAPNSNAVAQASSKTMETIAKPRAKTMTVKWKAVSGATNYLVGYKSSTAKTWSYAVSGGKTSHTFTGMKEGNLMEFRVAVYDGKKVARGEWTQINCRFYREMVSLKAAAGAGKISLSWGKVSGATGYQALVATKADFSDARVMTFAGGSTTKATITTFGDRGAKLKSGKTYYVKMRPTKTANNANGKQNTYIGIQSLVRVCKNK